MECISSRTQRPKDICSRMENRSKVIEELRVAGRNLQALKPLKFKELMLTTIIEPTGLSLNKETASILLRTKRPSDIFSRMENRSKVIEELRVDGKSHQASKPLKFRELMLTTTTEPIGTLRVQAETITLLRM